jgi:ArsR family transcriptional regulator, cadmium/lead-responsive transcriptional repressor
MPGSFCWGKRIYRNQELHISGQKRNPGLRIRGIVADVMEPDGQDADRLWAALGDPMRLRLLDLLLERGEATASALAAELPITRQGIAKHLVVLQRAGLVDARRAGRETRYTVRDERLGQARQQMARVASRWDARLALIKQLAEAEPAPLPPESNRKGEVQWRTLLRLMSPSTGVRSRVLTSGPPDGSEAVVLPAPAGA